MTHDTQDSGIRSPPGLTVDTRSSLRRHKFMQLRTTPRILEDFLPNYRSGKGMLDPMETLIPVRERDPRDRDAAPSLTHCAFRSRRRSPHHSAARGAPRAVASWRQHICSLADSVAWERGIDQVCVCRLYGRGTGDVGAAQVRLSYSESTASLYR